MRTIYARVENMTRRAYDYIRQSQPSGVLFGAGVALLVLFVLTVVPPLVLLAIPALLILGLFLALSAFARAWVREFSFLMHLSDDAFPGDHDKLIWAMLLIVLPPVGIRLFHNFRETHWPEAKPTTAHEWM